MAPPTWCIQGAGGEGGGGRAMPHSRVLHEELHTAHTCSQKKVRQRLINVNKATDSRPSAVPSISAQGPSASAGNDTHHANSIGHAHVQWDNAKATRVCTCIRSVFVLLVHCVLLWGSRSQLPGLA